MFRILAILTLKAQLHLMTALFVVEVPQELYTVEYGSNITMECRFPVNGELNLKLLSVVWEQKEQKEQESKEVYTLHKGEEILQSQHSRYQGRATLLHDQLKLGRSVLQIIDVKLMDAGSYRCLIDYQGADYKYVILKVKASYKKIHIQGKNKPDEEKLVLTCRSEGFPPAEVFWHNEKNQSVSANTTYTLTTDGLYNVTSIATVKPETGENYSCMFWNKELNEATLASVSTLGLVSSENVGQKPPILFIVPTCVIAVIFLSAILIFWRKKTFTKFHGKKDKRRQIHHLSREENRELNTQTQDLISMNVTSSRGSREESL
ncbi:programmed cell death 1 ligand 2 [Alligator sinensis]|uniref:Programmed cell death 1 ligand 2 n=1 Tax=Alligator sinensis TaxID=38654 RepID=A0A1U8CUP6_ALLSI|nr:programmed cell death 1 ligand 2 [Alligator sinensis]